MKMHWKHAMLAELLFMTLEGEGKRIVIGMIQPNGTRFQSMIIFPHLTDSELKCLGFYESPDVAKRVVETEIRATWRGSAALFDDPENCVVREYEREVVSA